ncbi:hypothetical protein [Rummeliibacillus stabekisii]|uniref:hypothetical protein n=1 Tax=Rummeliibacillus stabekisii TaxID=241244 RepID=UPI003711D491
MADFILKSLPSYRGFLFVGMVIAMFICSISTISYLVSERESLSFILDLIATVLAMFIFTNSLVSIQSFEDEKNHFLSLLGDEHTKLHTKINKKEHTLTILPIIFLFLIVLNLAWQAEQFQFYIYNELIFVVLAVIIYKGLQAKKRTSALLELLQEILSEYETKR